MLERETGFEPATLALARRCSTTELFPLDHSRSERWNFTDARTKLSSDQVGHTHHCYLVTLGKIVQNRYQKVTRKYCNQAIDFLRGIFYNLVSTHRVKQQVLSEHIFRSSSTITFQAICSLLFSHLLYFSYTHLDLSKMVRILLL